MNKYLTILKFEVTHTYYANGLCPDFSFSPSPQTEKLIKGHRLQVKYQPAGFELHAPLGADNKLLIPLEKGIEFRWLLKPKTNSFYNFTALPQRDANGQYRISSQKGVVINGAKFSEFGGIRDSKGNPVQGSFGSLAKTFTSVHGIVKRNGKQQISLSRSPVLNAKIQDFEFSNAIRENEIDMDSFQWKLIDPLTIELIGNVQKSTTIAISYPVATKAGANIFASLDMVLDKAFIQAPNSKLSYTLSLNAKQIPWEFFILTKKNKSLDVTDTWQLEIDDDVPPVQVNIISLDESSDLQKDHLKAGLIWEKLKSRVSSNGNAYFISSVAPLPLRQKQLNNLVIQHEKVKDVWEDIIPNLPAPLPSDQGVQVIYYPEILTIT